MHGYYYVDMMGNLPHSIVALIDLLINFRVHLFDDDHLISDECHAPLILLAQQVPINFSHLHQQRYEAARSWPLWKTQRFYPSHEGRTHHKKAREGKHRVQILSLWWQWRWHVNSEDCYWTTCFNGGLGLCFGCTDCHTAWGLYVEFKGTIKILNLEPTAGTDFAMVAYVRGEGGENGT